METTRLLEEVRRRIVYHHGDLLLSTNGKGYTDVVQVIQKEVRAILKKADPETEEAVVADLIGLGPADALLKDPEVSEVMINGPDVIYVERNGRLEKMDLRYPDAETVTSVLYRVVQRCGRKVNFSTPLVDARLPDGSRVNAIIPPAAPYPIITIRKFVHKVFTTKDLLQDNFLSQDIVDFFSVVIPGKANIVVAGATGCGKTTFIRWLGGLIPCEERLLIIEDTRELELDHPHCLPLEASDKAPIYALMINALRMRPDRIILGEVRGAEAFELLQAMGTGHEGSITSVHANYGKMEAVHRLVRAMIKVGGVTADELQAMVAETIDLLVFVKRFPDGARRIIHVSQMESDHGMPVFRDIFRYWHKTGRHEQVGVISKELRERLQENLLDEMPNSPALGGDAVV